MRQLLTIARRTASTARAAALSVVNPARLFEATTTPATAPEPADLYTPDEMPAPEEIEAAARTYGDAAEQARRADRGKRAARKILDRLPAGLYGSWQVERVPSGRSTVDLNEVRRIFKAHGLGDVPMKSAAPSLKVTRLAAVAQLPQTTAA